MADPFSITGSAVGVVSLAIQVCKGLEWYLSGVKEAKNKAEQIAAETEELANLLEQLESVIGKVDPSQSVSTTRTGIVSCANAIATIRKKLKPDDQAANNGIKSSLKRLTKRLAFPFKEADIAYWKDVLNTIQQSLQTALLALVIDQQRLASESARFHYTQLSMDQSIHHFSNLQLQRDVFDATSLQLAGQSHMLESGFSATSRSVQSLHADFRNFQEQLLQAASAKSTTLDDDLVCLRGVQRKTRKLQRRSDAIPCTCRPQTSALGYMSRLLTLAYTQRFDHDRRCLRYSLPDISTDLQFKATLCSLVLKRRISLSFTRFNNAGFTQSLQCHRIVDRDSPAFAYVDTLVRNSVDTPMKTFVGEVAKLSRMFQLRQASPHDRLANGKTLLHVVCNYISFQDRTKGFANAFENLGYLFKILLPLMLSEAFETDDRGATCIDILMGYNPSAQNRDAYIGLLRSLFEQDLQITRYTYETASYRSNNGLSILAEIPYESFTSPLLDDSELLEAVFMKSDHQLQSFLHQPRYLHTMSTEMLADALIMSTITGWVDGCRALLDANLMACLGDPSSATAYPGQSLLSISVVTKQPDMLQFWLSQREKCDEQQLDLIGYVEETLSSGPWPPSGTLSMDVIQLPLSHLIKQRQEVKLLMEKHELEHCCERARTSLPDTHLSCMLTALVTEGVDVPQRYWPQRKTLYYMPDMWKFDKVNVFESFELAGICDISQENFKCNQETACSPLVYLSTQSMVDIKSGCLTERSLTVQWFLSRGAKLNETWPGTSTTAVHCLAWQSAICLQGKVRIAYEDDAPMEKDCSTPIMNDCWTYEDYEFLVKEDILDDCECGCSRSGCDFLSCFWKQTFEEGWCCPPFLLICERFKDANLATVLESDRLYAPNDDFVELRYFLFTRILLDLTLWVEKATTTLALDRLIHGYIRLFVFSYFEIRHTCCDINRIQHRDDWWYWEDPDSTRQPYPRYSTKELRRMSSEDACLHGCLEDLVPKLIAQHGSFGGKLEDFVIEVLIPTMRKTARELKEEDKALYATGRRELGVVMDEDEDETEEEDDAEEEEVDFVEESDDEY